VPDSTSWSSASPEQEGGALLAERQRDVLAAAPRGRVPLLNPTDVFRWLVHIADLGVANQLPPHSS
jgi:hypothetical protein